MLIIAVDVEMIAPISDMTNRSQHKYVNEFPFFLSAIGRDVVTNMLVYHVAHSVSASGNRSDIGKAFLSGIVYCLRGTGVAFAHESAIMFKNSRKLVVDPRHSWSPLLFLKEICPVSRGCHQHFSKMSGKCWSGRLGLNQRPHAPQAGARGITWAATQPTGVLLAAAPYRAAAWLAGTTFSFGSMTPRFLTTLKMPLLAWAIYIFSRA